MAINAGKRMQDNTPPRTIPLRKGLVECDACGRVVRPAARKVPHPETAECQAQQVVNAYDARGWTQVFNVTMGKLIEETGTPLEWALGGVHAEAATASFDEFGRRRGTARSVMVRHLVGFVPRDTMRLTTILTRVQIPPAFRRRAIAALWDRPDMITALDTVRRLDSTKFKALLHEAVVEAEAQKEAARGAPAEQT